METVLNISAIAALMLPILLILFSLLIQQTSKKRSAENQPSSTASDELMLSDPSKEALVSIFSAKKILRETLRIVFEKYRGGSAGLKSPPDEAESLAQQLLFAVYKLQSNNEKDIMSSLQTLAALGTQKLLAVLEDDLKLLEKQWENNIRVNRMIQKSRQRMSGRLESRRTIGIILRPAKLAEYEEAISSNEDEDDESLVKVSY